MQQLRPARVAGDDAQGSANRGGLAGRGAILLAGRREDKTVVAVVVVVVSCSCRRWSEAGVVGVDVKVEGGPRRSQKSPQRRQQRPSSRDSEGRQPKNSATESSRQQAASSGQDADEADEADEGEGRETSQRSKKSESERDGTTRKNKTDVEKQSKTRWRMGRASGRSLEAWAVVYQQHQQQQQEEATNRNQEGYDGDGREQAAGGRIQLDLDWPMQAPVCQSST
ncbi:hypothetical protein HL42_4506 [Trichophyton rubrum]|nr:hypothetical protein HL42_4506 [Trichophyton rubrum]